MNVYQRYLAKGDYNYYGRYTDPVTHKRKLVHLGTAVKKDALKRLKDLYTAAQERRFDAVDQTKIEKTVQALTSLRSKDRNAYLAFLLAYGAGLRRNEIAHARYDWISEREGRHFLSIGTTEDFRPKGRDARTVPLEKFVVDEINALRTTALRSTPAENYIMVGIEWERKDASFRRLAAVMRSVGWSTHKMAHELRKLYGSMVATTHGLFAAQKLLGHKSPELTSRYYAGLTNLPTVQMFKSVA